MKIGVFDSGIGGKSVALAIEKGLPTAEVIFVSDQQNLPYGSKSPEELYGLVLPILQKLATTTDIIVIACNTVSTTLVGKLREVISVPLVALEPMVKPAAEQTVSKVITVCATPTTLQSQRYKWLKETYAQNVTVLEPDCSDWSRMIESNAIDQKQITEAINSTLQAGADVIVLGCTHYHWIEEMLKTIAEGHAKVIQPEQVIVSRLKKLITEL